MGFMVLFVVFVLTVSSSSLLSCSKDARPDPSTRGGDRGQGYQENIRDQGTQHVPIYDKICRNMSEINKCGLTTLLHTCSEYSGKDPSFPKYIK